MLKYHKWGQERTADHVWQYNLPFRALGPKSCKRSSAHSSLNTDGVGAFSLFFPCIPLGTHSTWHEKEKRSSARPQINAVRYCFQQISRENLPPKQYNSNNQKAVLRATRKGCRHSARWLPNDCCGEPTVSIVQKTKRQCCEQQDDAATVPIGKKRAENSCVGNKKVIPARKKWTRWSREKKKMWRKELVRELFSLIRQ